MLTYACPSSRCGAGCVFGARAYVLSSFTSRAEALQIYSRLAYDVIFQSACVGLILNIGVVCELSFHISYFSPCKIFDH